MSIENCADESDGMDMRPGQFVTSSLGKYFIKELLGKGGYGAVYKVSLDGFERMYALKAEKKVSKRDHTKLNMEVYILKAMAHIPEDKSHFARIYDKVKKNNFYMIVMTLLGKSLGDLKKMRKPAIFSTNTGYAASLQCLEAIEELHKLCFIHRDLKPGNFAIGMSPRQDVVYILDFGIARRVVNERNELRAPRVKVPFKGTVRFAPLAAHENKEQTYKDDCESWFYMIIDMINPKGVPWRMCDKKEEVAEMKKRVRDSVSDKERLFYGMSTKEFVEGFEYITRLSYTEKPSYNFLYQMIRAAAAKDHVKMEPPFDWNENDSKSGTTPTSSGHKSRGTASGSRRHKSSKHKSHAKKKKRNTRS